MYNGSRGLSLLEYVLNARLRKVDLSGSVRVLEVEMHRPVVHRRTPLSDLALKGYAIDPTGVAEETANMARAEVFLKTLPKMRFSKKRGVLSVDWLPVDLGRAELDEPEFAEPPLTVPSFQRFNRELQRVVAAVGLAHAKRTHTDFGRLEDLLRQLYDEPLDDIGLRQLREVARASLVDKVDDPWACLEPLLDTCHPDARRILDHPFYWSPDEEFGPIGNDTGADILEDYRRFAKRGVPEDGLKMLRRWIEKHEAADYSADVFIAGAFAQIMIHGYAVPDVAREGIAALEQRDASGNGATKEWSERMRRVLEAFT